MEFDVPRDELFELLTTARKYLSKTVPALSNFLFEVDDASNMIQITASDSQNIFRSKVPGTVHVKGSMILSAPILYGALKNFASDKVTFKMDPAGNLYMKCKKQKVRVPITNAQSFLQVPQLKADESFRIPSDELISLIKGTSFAKLKNPNTATEYKFEGVNIKITQGQATFICSDRNRIAIGRYKFQNAVDAEFTFSGKSMEDFVNGLETGNTVEIKWDKTANRCFLETGRTTLYPALYAEKYPDVGKYVPKPSSTITVKRQKLINSLEIANLVNEHIELKAEGKELKLSNQDTVNGAFAESITANITADSEVSLRASYFLEGLKAMAGDEVELMIEDERKPVVIRPKQKSDYAYLLIPVV